MLWVPIVSLIWLVIACCQLGWPGLAVWACTIPFICMALAGLVQEENHNQRK